jgi:hypothetical protein
MDGRNAARERTLCKQMQPRPNQTFNVLGGGIVRLEDENPVVVVVGA